MFTEIDRLILSLFSNAYLTFNTYNFLINGGLVVSSFNVMKKLYENTNATHAKGVW